VGRWGEALTAEYIAAERTANGPTPKPPVRVRVNARAFLTLVTGFFFLGCGDEARIGAEARLDPPLAVDMLSVTVRDGDRIWTWHGSDFRGTVESPTPGTPPRVTRTNGTLEVSFALEASDKTVSSGSITLPLREDWVWGVTVTAATTDPQEGCFGCFGSKAFPLAEGYRTPEGDSIWLVWGGNSISDPAIY
jgi:hypothetical protein